jgi:hypothetical protein
MELNVSNSLLTTVQENLILLEQVSNDILDASSSDPVLVSIVTRLCTGITCQNNVLTEILQRNTYSDSGNGGTVKKGPPTAPKPSSSRDNRDGHTTTQVQKVYDNSSRNTLKQAPLGGANGPWNELKGKKNKKPASHVDAENSGTGSRTQNDGIDEIVVQTSDAFTTAVREAERSIVIYNLDLGQSPLLNPSTISSKVTAALISAAACNLKKENSNPMATAGEMVNDLLSQVKGMVLFGKGTRPCKDPKNSENNGKYYTVPVKLSFNNKQVAKSVNDILRQQYKVSTSIPYHKTLKKAMTLAHEKVSKANPGMQVLISLDTSNRNLKQFVREPPVHKTRTGPANWLSAGNPLPLPSEALDPKIRNVPEDFTLPTTPVLSTPSGSTSGLPRTGLEHRRLKYGPGLEHLERRNSNDMTPPTDENNPGSLEKVGMDIDSEKDLQDGENALSKKWVNWVCVRPTQL